MNTVPAIKNTENYALRMEGSMAEKLFFLNQIPTGAVDTIVDFGCADGCLFQAMRQLGIDWKQIGSRLESIMRWRLKSYSHFAIQTPPGLDHNTQH